MHVYGIQKNRTDEFICRAAMGKQTQRTDLWTSGRGEERMKCMERVTWKLTLPYVKQIGNGNLLMSQGTQTGALYQLEGWDAEGDGRKVQEGGDICTPMADSC